MTISVHWSSMCKQEADFLYAVGCLVVENKLERFAKAMAYFGAITSQTTCINFNISHQQVQFLNMTQFTFEFENCLSVIPKADTSFPCSDNTAVESPQNIFIYCGFQMVSSSRLPTMLCNSSRISLKFTAAPQGL